MGFRLEVRTCKYKKGSVRRVGYLVAQSSITLGNALQLIVYMFCARARLPVLVSEFGPQGITIYYPYYVSLLGDQPLANPDAESGHSGGFVHQFIPESPEDYDQLIEMVAAYLLAFPELGSSQVNELIKKIRPSLAA